MSSDDSARTSPPRDEGSSAWMRALHAIPDAVMAAGFATLWFRPLALGKDGVATALLVMLVEFLLVHASGFLGGMALAPGIGWQKKLAWFGGFSLFYLVFVFAFSMMFDAWWPFLAFGWLLVGKLLVMVDRSAGADLARARMLSGWALAAVFYVLGAFVTVLMPLPRFGLTPGVVGSLGLPGDGLWVDQPHTVVAFGTLYFAMLAWSKWRDWLLPATDTR